MSTLPDGFIQTTLTDTLAAPTAMEVAPDGRIFVAEKEGPLRIVEDGILLPTPFLNVPVDSRGERGLVGVTLDPDFGSNGYVYVYYTTTTEPHHNRISRFTASGDVALPGSEVVLLDLDPLADGHVVHNGGAMHFGPDGALYVGVGDNQIGANAQRLDTLKGKILRLNADGSIPADNPFLDQTTGPNQAIWAMGLRNPFTFDIQSQTGTIYINDVGQNAYEEINEGAAGANYGWPVHVGPGDGNGYVGPIYKYQHQFGAESACAITGGAFYDPQAQQFPDMYENRYFFSDYCGHWIKTFDPETSEVETFATALGLNTVDLDVDDNGNLYVLGWTQKPGEVYTGTGVIEKIQYLPESPPILSTLPASQRVPDGQPVTFTLNASSSAPVVYQWQRDGVDIPGANEPSYTLPATTLYDNGARFRVVVTNRYGQEISTATTLNVVESHPPTVTITEPTPYTYYVPGQIIPFAAVAIDSEDGVLPPQAFTWFVDFHHNTHTHPNLPPTAGIDQAPSRSPPRRMIRARTGTAFTSPSPIPRA